eukprot:TRINITY_DN6717_c0_g1_i2.p1 TRINITY_DN6717_c0_g1~~TRINITY_DN6717_c0_g1_i2.p1  ORF type:complete len:273 (+),score=88.57 TRINITY_DN6717_c0_g1_i2:36-854(+)
MGCGFSNEVTAPTLGNMVRQVQEMVEEEIEDAIEKQEKREKGKEKKKKNKKEKKHKKEVVDEVEEQDEVDEDEGGEEEDEEDDGEEDEEEYQDDDVGVEAPVPSHEISLPSQKAPPPPTQKASQAAQPASHPAEHDPSVPDGSVQLRTPDKDYPPNPPAPPKAPTLAEIKQQATQAVAKIKDSYASEKKRFVDTSFPPTSISLWRNPFDPAPAEEILHPTNWRRLSAMAPSPVRLYGDNPSPAEIVQGGIGTCFLMSAVSVLCSIRPDVIKV